MLFQSLIELWSVPLVVIALAMPLGRAFVLRRELWFDRKIAFALKEIPLNVVLTTIIVMLGLLAVLITPILPLKISFRMLHQKCKTPISYKLFCEEGDEVLILIF